MSNSPCPICGKETAKGNRYCADCDYDGSGPSVAPARRAQVQAPARGGNLSLVLLFFVVSAFGTVLTGVFAPNALSLPLLSSGRVAESVEWGEVRTVRVASRIRAQASTGSEIMQTLAPGDSVRVEPVANGWFRAYPVRLVPRVKARPLGFIYGTLLDPAKPNVVSAGITGSN